MLLAYVAGPYRADGEWAVWQNIQRASEIALELWRMGFAVICPHRNTAFFGGAAPDDVWLKGDLEILRRCDLVVLVPGWQKSTGTCAEVREAQGCEIPVYEWATDESLLRGIAEGTVELGVLSRSSALGAY